jgi:hypothetical protein
MPATADQPILHDGRFVLIDGQGRIRGAYHSNDPRELADLERDARRLLLDTPGRARALPPEAPPKNRT